MAQHLKLVVRTPEAEVINEPVESIYFSNEKGYMMILPHHASISTSTLYSSLFLKRNNVVEEFTMKNAIIYFSNEKNEAIILCLSIKQKEGLDYVSVKKYLELIETKLAQGNEEDLKGYKYKFLENEKMVLVKEMQEIEAKSK